MPLRYLTFITLMRSDQTSSQACAYAVGLYIDSIATTFDLLVFSFDKPKAKYYKYIGLETNALMCYRVSTLYFQSTDEIAFFPAELVVYYKRNTNI